MRLTLDEAAVKLGKSSRQVRYLVSSGRLPAQKIGGRWFIDSTALPLSSGQQQALDRRERQLRSAVDEALEIDRPAPRRYSVRDMKAFQLIQAAHVGAGERLGADHAATCFLKVALEHLACGCHRFDRADKADAYRAARDAASKSVCELYLDGRDAANEIAASIEQDALAAVAGLLRRVDRRPSR